MISVHNVPYALQHIRHVFTGEIGYTLGSLRKIAHKGTHGETRVFSDGGGITTLGAFRTFTNIPGPGNRTANFAAFGSWSGVLPKNAKSLRDSDALIRVAVPRRRGPAGLRDLFCFCRNCDLYAMCSGPFRACERGGGITTLGALCVLLKCRTAACQNGSFAVSLRPLICICESPCRVLPTSASIQISHRRL